MEGLLVCDQMGTFKQIANLCIQTFFLHKEKKPLTACMSNKIINEFAI